MLGIQGLQRSRRNKGNIGTVLSSVIRDYHDHGGLLPYFPLCRLRECFLDRRSGGISYVLVEKVLMRK